MPSSAYVNWTGPYFELGDLHAAIAEEMASGSPRFDPDDLPYPSAHAVACRGHDYLCSGKGVTAMT